MKRSALEELLPWYVNETLDPHERAQVDAEGLRTNRSAPASRTVVLVIASFAFVMRAPRHEREPAVFHLVEDVERAIGGVQTYARLHDGVVVSLEDDVPSDPHGRHTAKMAVRVPAASFDAAMESLAGFGALQGRSVNAEDLGRQLVDGAARLRNLRRTESDLLRIMDRSGRVADILEVQNQLSATREAIEQLDSEVHSMRERVDYATVTLTLASTVHGASAIRGLRGFTVALVALALAGIVFVPYALVGAGLLYLAWRRLRH